MSMSCHNLDFGTRVLDLVAVGSSSNSSIERQSVKNYGKIISNVSSKGYGTGRMVYCRQNITRSRVFSTKTSEAPVKGNIMITQQDSFQSSSFFFWL